MQTVFAQYKEKRAAGAMNYYIPRAADVLRDIKSDAALDQWRKANEMPRTLYTDSRNVAHTIELEHGYKIELKLESDYDAPYDDMKHQGYSYDVRGRGYDKPEFAQHGEFTRHNGDGFRAWLDLSNDRDYIPAVFDVPESFVRQFYDGKQWGKNEAYSRMVADARAAIERDVKTFCKTDYYTISAHLIAANGEEVESDYLGGCDDDYAQSGAAFHDHGMIETMRAAAETHRLERFTVAPLMRGDDVAGYCVEDRDNPLKVKNFHATEAAAQDERAQLLASA